MDPFQYLIKLFCVVKVTLSKPVTLIIAIPFIAMPAFTTPQRALIILAGLFIGDFITGIIASWIEFRRSLPVTPGSGKRYVIQSSKLRLSAVKFVTYGMVAIVAFVLEWGFVAGEFEPHASLKKMTLTTMAIGFCCLIETYSIFFENVKRMGFDIIQVVTNIVNKGWKFWKSLKKE